MSLDNRSGIVNTATGLRQFTELISCPKLI